MGAVLPTERHGVGGRGEEPRVSDGRFGDVGAEAFDGGYVAAGLGVYAPVVRPGCGIGLPAELAGSGAEVGPEPPLHGDEGAGKGSNFKFGSGKSESPLTRPPRPA